jgi:hypothetical protein
MGLASPVAASNGTTTIRVRLDIILLALVILFWNWWVANESDLVQVSNILWSAAEPYYRMWKI